MPFHDRSRVELVPTRVLAVDPTAVVHHTEDRVDVVAGRAVHRAAVVLVERDAMPSPAMSPRRPLNIKVSFGRVWVASYSVRALSVDGTLAHEAVER